MLLQSCQQNVFLKPIDDGFKKDTAAAAVYNTELGLLYLKRGNISRSKQKLLTALKFAPSAATTNEAFAYYLEKTGDINEARAYYKKALVLSSMEGAVLNNYGGFLCRIGEYQQAETYFLKAIKDTTYIHTAAAYENAGLCAAAGLDYAKASYYFNKALAQDPHLKLSLYGLLTIAVKQEHFNDALNYLQRYPELCLHDTELLAIGIKIAHKTGHSELEKKYQKKQIYLSRLSFRLFNAQL